VRSRRGAPARPSRCPGGASGLGARRKYAALERLPLTVRPRKQRLGRPHQLHSALITQMAQTAVCNRHHSVDQQLCRWLLLSLDRLSSNQLTMTQELIANMLGVRREGVTEAAGKLDKLGVIRYARGHITVLDRPKLEQLCCECYAVVRKENRSPPAASSTSVRRFARPWPRHRHDLRGLSPALRAAQPQCQRGLLRGNVVELMAGRALNEPRKFKLEP